MTTQQKLRNQIIHWNYYVDQRRFDTPKIESILEIFKGACRGLECEGQPLLPDVDRVEQHLCQYSAKRQLKIIFNDEGMHYQLAGYGSILETVKAGLKKIGIELVDADGSSALFEFASTRRFA